MKQITVFEWIDRKNKAHKSPVTGDNIAARGKGRAKLEEPNLPRDRRRDAARSHVPPGGARPSPKK
jgi:hypothetical protein